MYHCEMQREEKLPEKNLRSNYCILPEVYNMDKQTLIDGLAFTAFCLSVIAIVTFGLYVIAPYLLPDENVISQKPITVKKVTNINGEFLIDAYDGYTYVSKEPFSLSIFEVNKTYNVAIGNYYGNLHKQRENGIYGLIIGVDEV